MRIALKLAALSLILAGLQLASEPLDTYWCAPPLVREAQRIVAQPQPVLFLGDSTLRDQYGDPRRATPAVLDRELNGLGVDALYHAGFALPQYEVLVRHFLRQGARPSLIVAPINLRAFSPTWSQNPHRRFERERLFFEYGDSFLFRAFFKPMATLKLYDLKGISDEEFGRIPFFDGEEEAGRIRDLQSAAERCDETEGRLALIARYMGNVSKDHRNLQAMRSIIRACREAGVPLLLYITPIDGATGDRELDGRLSPHLRQHAKQVAEVAAEEGESVLDCLESLPPEAFIQGAHESQDHLTREGEDRLGTMLASAAKKRLEDAR